MICANCAINFFVTCNTLKTQKIYNWAHLCDFKKLVYEFERTKFLYIAFELFKMHACEYVVKNSKTFNASEYQIRRCSLYEILEKN